MSGCRNNSSGSSSRRRSDARVRDSSGGNICNARCRRCRGVAVGRHKVYRQTATGNNPPQQSQVRFYSNQMTSAVYGADKDIVTLT